ncbi:MAG: SAM-dependent methyltransferase [Microcoleaceae cyanobacterium]
MTPVKFKAKKEYGDFQTPLDLATQVCRKVSELGINPQVVIEPTCGVGNFIRAASEVFSSAERIIGVDINSTHLQTINSQVTSSQITSSQAIKNTENGLENRKIELYHKDFFEFNWSSLIESCQGEILILGNFPWVTNSQQGRMGSPNLPHKHNFQKHLGLDAITGKSNFDISEWMLIQVLDWIHPRNGCLAMLCKTSVARKLLNYIHSQRLNLAYCSTHPINARECFSATVAACLLICKFESNSHHYFCHVFESLNGSNSYQLGYYDQTLITDIESFQLVSPLFNPRNPKKWRSGVKHDCSNVMELWRRKDGFTNGFGESVDIEETYLYPLLKGSDIMNGKIDRAGKCVLLPQKNVGQSTESIQNIAPKTWSYLEKNSKYLEARKSRIYKNTPRFSIFGVGDYTFTAWKIAICGLDKRLNFRLVNSIGTKPVVFDDTVYFLGFENEQAACIAFGLLTSQVATTFYSCLTFWDEKRPIKASILNCLDLTALEKTFTKYN